MNAVIYARYSSTSQRDVSIEIQLNECRKYCENNGYTVVKEYIDRAKSGTNDNRPDFQRMIEDSSRKAFECVVVYRFNRFARSRTDSVLYKAMLKKNGVRVLSVHEQITDDPTGVILESIIEGMDEFYSLELAQKIRGGMDKNGEKCLSTGGNIALGYKVNKESKRFEINPDTAPIVQMVFQMYADGKTVTEITKHLNSLGYKTARGVSFNKNSLHTMLKNKRYIGIYTYKGSETPGGIPRIISDELFDKVAKIMAKNREAPARSRAKEEYLLTTKLFCGLCKEMMTGSSSKSKGRKYKYYKCNGEKDKKCNKKTVRKEYIEDLVVAQCRKLLTPSNINKIAKEVATLCEAEQETSNLQYLKKSLFDNERRYRNLLNSVSEAEDPEIRADLYKEMSQLKSEHNELEKQIAKESAILPTLTEPKIKFFLTSLRKGAADDIKYRKTLISIFVNKIFLYDDRFTITFNSGDEEVTINDVLLSEIEENDTVARNLFLAGDGPPR